MSHIYANIVQFQIQICKLVFVNAPQHCLEIVTGGDQLYAAIKLGMLHSDTAFYIAIETIFFTNQSQQFLVIKHQPYNTYKISKM